MGPVIGESHIYTLPKIIQYYKIWPKYSKFPENWRHSNWKNMANLLTNAQSDENGQKVNE